MPQIKAPNFSSNDNKILKINEFGGLDLSHSVLKVSEGRASQMYNFIKENGTNQKRHGFREIAQFGMVTDGYTPLKVNGFWEYIDEDGNNRIVVHAGRNLFHVENFGESNQTINEISTAGLQVSPNDNVSFGVVSNNKLYILFGNCYVVYRKINGSYALRKVYNDDATYIPTTTIGIACEGSNVTGTRKTLDKPNLLSDRRINQLRGETSTEGNTYETYGAYQYGFYLDVLSEPGNVTNVVVKVKTSEGTITLPSSEYTVIDTAQGDEYANKMIYFKNNYPPIAEGEDNIFVEFTYKMGLQDMINKCTFGVVYGIQTNRDRLFLSGNPDYPNMDFRSGDRNIYTLGSNDLSYLSDYSYFPTDYYTSFGTPASKVNGYALLPDGSMAVIKSKSLNEPSIYYRTATIRAVLDENGKYVLDMTGNNVYEETYPVVPGNIGESPYNWKTIRNLSGDILFFGENGVFGIETLSGTNNLTLRYAKPRSRLIDKELLSPKVDNLTGLEISNDDAFAYVYKGKYYLCLVDRIYIADSRYKSRLEDDMSDTFQYEWWKWTDIHARIMFEHNNNLYIGNEYGQIMIYDENIYYDQSTVIVESGDVIYETENTQETNMYTFNRELSTIIESLHDNDSFIVKNEANNTPSASANSIFVYIGTVNRIGNREMTVTNEDGIVSNELKKSVIYLPEDEFKNTYHGLIVYVDNIRSILSGSLSTYTKYRISYGEDREEMIDAQTFNYIRLQRCTSESNNTWEYVTFDFLPYVNNEYIANPLFRICSLYPTTNVIYEVQNANGLLIKDTIYFRGNRYDKNTKLLLEGIDAVFNKFKVKWGNNQLKLARYNNVPIPNIVGEFHVKQPVECLYATKVYDLGTTLYTKNISRISITPDVTVGGSITFGYQTKNVEKYFNVDGVQVFDLNDISFENFSFETSKFPKSFNKKLSERNFNHIMFVFKSNNSANCVINNITLLYKFGRLNRGVN